MNVLRHVARETLEVSPKHFRVHYKPSERISDVTGSFEGLRETGYLSEYLDTLAEEVSTHLVLPLFQNLQEEVKAKIEVSNPQIPIFNLKFSTYKETVPESLLHPQRGIISILIFNLKHAIS